MGGALVICLFSWLAYIGFRIAARSAHQFLALTAATLTAGVVAQAFINMGYVVGLLPVTGINLPMISAGGTSAVITLGAMGILANCARHEPDTIAAMANFGKPAFDRVLFLPTNQPRPPHHPRQPQPHGAAPQRPQTGGDPWPGCRRGCRTKPRRIRPYLQKNWLLPRSQPYLPTRPPAAPRPHHRPGYQPGSQPRQP